MHVEWWEYTELNRSFDVCGMVGTLQNSSGHLMHVEWWEYTELKTGQWQEYLFMLHKYKAYIISTRMTTLSAFTV